MESGDGLILSSGVGEGHWKGGVLGHLLCAPRDVWGGTVGWSSPGLFGILVVNLNGQWQLPGAPGLAGGRGLNSSLSAVVVITDFILNSTLRKKKKKKKKKKGKY